MSAAGLGLRLHDGIYGSEYVRAFDQWWGHAESAYLRLDEELPKALTMYYDPLIDHHHELPPPSSLGVAFYLAPHRREAAARLWQWTKQGYGWAGDAPRILPMAGQPRTNILGQLMALEMGEEELAALFAANADEHHEPTWDRERGEHTWGFGLDEPHPRGQYNALQALADVVDEGAWSRLFRQPNLKKLEEPTIEGIDFPDLLLSRARWQASEERLVFTTVPRTAALHGRVTRFRVVGLDAAGAATPWRLLRDGHPVESVRFTDGVLEVEDRLGAHDYAVERDR